MEVKIKDQDKLVDATIEMVDGVMVVSPKNVYVPKDGDVVVNGAFVFIYNDWLTAEAYYYCGMNFTTSNVLFPNGGNIGYVNQLRPAAEEEKKLLFDKIDQEGYEWLADERKLVKKKWMPEYDEDYYCPFFDTFKFKIACYTWYRCELDFIMLGKGWVFRTEEECQKFCEKLNQAINSINP